MAGLFAELKRRNVIRMAELYIVGAWLIVQVAETILPAFDVPGWVLRALILLLAIGFLPALVVSWVFELTPDGLKRDADVAPGESLATSTGRRMDQLIFVGVLALIALVGVNRFWPRSEIVQTPASETATAALIADDAASATTSDSIAVLPFVNMSSDAEQSYFADGISEEILNALVRIPNLKVAGRTSSFSYKGQNQDLRAIGTELGVDHILEGSVRQAGARLRITAQLIRSEDGFHLWSETFDREVSDVFAVQDEIARTVADKLQLSLGLGSKALVTDTTEDLKAYENFLKARQLFNQRGHQNLLTAALLLNETIARDPSYAPAWALLGANYNTVPFYAPQDAIAAYALLWKDATLASARRAVALNPDNAFAQVTLGDALTTRREWIPAFEALDRAVELAPDDPAILDTVSQNLGQLGYEEEAKALSLRAVNLDPYVAIYRNSLGNASWGLGDIVDARQQFERAREIDPELSFPRFNLFDANVCLGDVDAAFALLLDSATRGELSDGLAASVKALTRPVSLSQLKTLIVRADFESPRALACMGETERVIKNSQSVWESPTRNFAALLDVPFNDLFQDPRWKAQIRKDGVLDLWRARGFPPRCKPLGEDDFECVAAEIKRG